MSNLLDPIIFATQDLFGVATETSTVVEVGACASADDLLVTVLDWAVGPESDWLTADSRNGRVIRAPALFTTSYHPDFVPVMLSPTRDANPFLHYVEAFYFLCGRNDVALMKYFAQQMGEYSDDGLTLWGSYGYRWMQHFDHDQVDAIVHELRKNPGSRRCVLQMWDGHQDLQRAIKGGLDVPCNHVASFDTAGGKLNMTVTNRSNDMIWGTYGANMVHFNILLNFVAHAVGLPKGYYHQVSSNTHVYTDFPITQRFLNPDSSLRESYRNEIVPISSWLPSHRPASLGVALSDLFSELDYAGWTSELNMLDVVFDEFLVYAADPTDVIPGRFPDLLANENLLQTSTCKNLLRFMKIYAMYKSGQLGEAHAFAQRLYYQDKNPFFYAGANWLETRIARKAEKEAL